MAGRSCQAVIQALVEPVDEANRARARMELTSLVNGPVRREALHVINEENKVLQAQHGKDVGLTPAWLAAYGVCWVSCATPQSPMVV